MKFIFSKCTDCPLELRDLVFSILKDNDWFDITTFEAAENLACYGLDLTPEVFVCLRILAFQGYLTFY